MGEYSALVTGGVRGIGLAISNRLAACGVRVAAGYSRDTEAAKRFLALYESQSCTVHQGNIGDPADCERVVAEVIEQHGHLDILVNNAGITVDKTVRKMGFEEWDRVLQVNVSGAFYLSHAVLQHMIDRGYGRIINISSVIGERGNIGQANYAAAKSGLFGLTKSLALETAKKGITVNCVTPGFVSTEMVAHRDGGGHASPGAGTRGGPDPCRAAGRTRRDRPRGGVPGRPRLRLHHWRDLRHQRRLLHVRVRSSPKTTP